MTGVTSKVDVGLAHGLAGYLFLGAVLGQMRLDPAGLFSPRWPAREGPQRPFWGPRGSANVRLRSFDGTLFSNLSPTIICPRR